MYTPSIIQPIINGKDFMRRCTTEYFVMNIKVKTPELLNAAT